MKKIFSVLGVIFVIMLVGCETNETEVVEQSIETVVEQPSDNIELSSDEDFELLMVTKFGDILVENNNEDVSVTYEIDQNTKTIHVFEDLRGIEELASGTLAFPDDLMSDWNELVDTFVGTSVSFQEMLDKYADGWTLVMIFGDSESDNWYVMTMDGELIVDTVSGFSFIEE